MRAVKTKKDKDSDTAEAIIQAARRLFSAYGHGKTTVREIAGEAKGAKATV